MSMFYELMMRKKEEIMYATIKGTLTENDGVFSGFSVSNYLQIQQNFTPQDKSWKIRATFTTGAEIESAKALFVLNAGTGNYGGVVFGTYSRHFWFNIGSTGTSWNIQATGQSSNIIQSYRQYTVEFGFTGTEYFIDNIENGVATRVFSVISSTPIYQNGISNIGLRCNDGNAFNGSIDLNNSYIKLGSTKYNLQAVVGYTVVGSPTITDGVVSGFSGSDYIRLPNNIGYNDFEVVIKVKSTVVSAWRPFFELRFSHDNSSNYDGNVTLQNGGEYFYSYTSPTSIRCGGTSSTTSWNWIKLIKTKSRIEISRSEDGINYTNPTVQTFEGDGFVDNPIKIGTAQNSSGFGTDDGEIDLNETYIKVNNKLYFNGQQA